MDITLISPYLDIFSYGVRSLSSTLREHGYSTRLIFLHDLKALTEGNFDYPRKYHPAVLDGVVELCQDSDLVGISVMSNFYDRSLELTRTIQERTGVPVMWGGIHPTLMPEECIELADMVFIGEGELALPEFMKKRKGGIDYYDSSNFWFKRNGEIIKNSLLDPIQDLNSIPMQDISLEEHYTINWEQNKIIEMDEKVFESLTTNGMSIGDRKPIFQVMATRGCPHKCSYCCNYAIEKLYPGHGRIRRRSVGNLIDELVYIKGRIPSIELFAFTDDSFMAADSDWLNEFSEEYKSKVGVPLFCLSSPVTINRKKMDLFVDTGLYSIEIGIQTGSAKTKKMYNREISNESVVKAAKLLNEYRDKIYPPVYDIILNNPLERITDMLDTVRLMHSLPHPKIFNYFSMTFFPGTLVLEMALEAGVVKDMIEDVYRKHYFIYGYKYINILYLLAEKRIPGWIFSILTNTALAYILNAILPEKLLKYLVTKAKNRGRE